jgi:hypothetical protein
VKIHLALLASLGLYCILLAQSRARMSADLHPTRTPRTDLPLACVAVVQLAVMFVIARKRLRSNPGPPALRARLYFMLRGVSAEVVALFGLMVGVLGAPILEAAALFALAIAAMLASYPTREAWDNAVREAQTPGS